MQTHFPLPSFRGQSLGLRLAQLATVALALFLLVVFVGGLLPRYEELRTICHADHCLPLRLNAADAVALADLGFSLAAYAVFHVVIELLVATMLLLLGAFLFWRLRDDWLGLGVVVMLVLFGLNFMVEADTSFTTQYPTVSPIINFLAGVATAPVILLFYLFPNGRFVPSWTRYLSLLMVATAVLNPLFIRLDLLIPSEQFSSVLLIVFMMNLVVGLAVQVYRYRRVSTLVERQQTKWILVGLAGIVFAILNWSLWIELFPLAPGRTRVLFNTLGFLLMVPLLLAFPVSLALSILRYRLWEIDVVIRRTAVYAILSAALALVYFGSVITLQALAGLVGQQQSPITVVLSTLLIAALFAPLRRRVQAAIDRRFYRRQYDAQQVLARFARAARDETDPRAINAALVRSIADTVQPEGVTVWLRK